MTLTLLKELLNASQGKIKAETIINNANMVSVTTGEILENKSIMIYKGYIVRITESRDELISLYKGNETNIINAKNSYVMPGFIENHIHIESSLLSVKEFGKLEIIHGVTTLIADPHEIGNVLGLKGVELFIEESKYALPRIFFEAPSCVPAVEHSKGLDSGAKTINNNDIKRLFTYDKVIGLGEVMDFNSVIEGSNNTLEKIELAHNFNKIIEGHAPFLTEEGLDSYILTGISSDHESSIVEELLEKARKGMYIFIREGSAWKNLRDLIKAITDYHIDSRRLIFVADDLNVVDLVEKGHIDYIINQSIDLGVDPIKAIQMATINPAEHLKIDDKVGIIAPGRYADLVISNSIDHIKVLKTMVNGKILFNEGKILFNEGNFSYPAFSKSTMNIKQFNEEDILIKTSIEEGNADVYVIKAIPGSSLTKKVIENLPIKKGFVRSNRNVMHIAVIDRHHKTGNIGKGFVENLEIKSGAIAQTIAHDTHNLIIAGYDPKDMITAAKYVIDSNGGIAYVDKGKLISMVKLPIAGLFSDQNYESVYRQAKQLEESLSTAGTSLNSIFMTLGLISLPVIPELRITDRGLVDVMGGKIISPLLSYKTTEIEEIPNPK
ncbi:MAG: adenine deaminase [Caldisphaera sp.]|nr:MAG: adenine deaminase [Caldisphaera sp.]PMP89783.1 MAG: adenine deaminase [Caldisphaera sp.]